MQLNEGKKGGYVEVEGSPDMVLEVISDSSVRKDDVLLRQGYWDAGIGEYSPVRRSPRTNAIRHSAPHGSRL